MASNLVIVESPAKAKTISGYLGKDFKVESCFGHIRDLPNKKIGVDVDNNFAPEYVINTDKKELVKKLKKQAKAADMVWLASDEDREGEAIAWHLSHALELTPDKTKRIVFNEITKKAILNAVENPREIDFKLVDAQQARRVLDRLVGYQLSPILWSKIKRGLSAGRVQSVAVKLVVDKENEIRNYTSTGSYKVSAKLKKDKDLELDTTLSKSFKTLEESQAFFESIQSGEFTLTDIQTKPLTRKPAPPYTTSSLQQDASSRLGFSVSRAMSVAQKLYEAGHITYMRTDSTNLSGTALEGIEKTVLDTWGEKYYNKRVYASKAKGAQEAHEAIRPTNFDNTKVSGKNEEQRLYDLIWRRTVASQMANAQFEKTTYVISFGDQTVHFKLEGNVMSFDGFIACMGNKSEDVILPSIDIGQVFEFAGGEAVQKLSAPPMRYNEASLVKKMEELGIGRPSTYAPTVNLIQKRDYVSIQDVEGELTTLAHLEVNASFDQKVVEKEEAIGKQNKRFRPSQIGEKVNEFLNEHFPKVMNYEFTAKVESNFDLVAEGSEEWEKVIDGFYQDFNKNIGNAKDNAERVDTARYLGKHPDQDVYISVRQGRYGPMVQCGGHTKYEEEDPAVFASIPNTMNIDTITMDECLALLSLPKKLGEMDKKEILLGIGRYGPYVKWNNAYYSVTQENYLELSLKQAVEIIQAKLNEKPLPEFEHEGEALKLMKGRYGPYFKYKKKNYPLPKKVDLDEVTLEQCLEIIEKKSKK